jgi:putative sigma-54 modulation protein
MTILFTGRKAHLTRPLKDFAEEKLAKVRRFLDEVEGVHVILTLEKHRHLAEIVVKAPGATLTAKSESADFHDSILGCVERLVAQAKKHRERGAKARRRAGARAVRRGPVTDLASLSVAAPGPPGDDGPSLVRMGRVPAKPMSVEEALLQMRDSRDGVLVFRNAESQQVSVIFKRPDGQFGLIEAEA